MNTVYLSKYNIQINNGHTPISVSKFAAAVSSSFLLYCMCVVYICYICALKASNQNTCFNGNRYRNAAVDYIRFVSYERYIRLVCVRAQLAQTCFQY